MATNSEVFEHMQGMQDEPMESVVLKFVEKYSAFERAIAHKDSPHYRQSCMALYVKMKRVQTKVKNLNKRAKHEQKKAVLW